jgi:hypothetical protein
VGRESADYLAASSSAPRPQLKQAGRWNEVKVFIDNMRSKSIFRRFFNVTPKPETIQSQAERGNADAQFVLGLRYASSEGAAQDYGQAVQWYLKAAEQNHVLAQFNLGIMYTNGQGVLVDDHQSAMWFDRAARQEDPGAEYYLGMRQYRASFHGTAGQMRESSIEAYKWFALAAALGYQDSVVARDTMSMRMSREDMAEGGLRGDKFLLSVRANGLGPVV